MTQLLLDLLPPLPPTRANFLPGDNAEALAALDAWLVSGRGVFHLWGEAGAGKTHLLSASRLPFVDATQNPDLNDLPCAAAAIDEMPALSPEGQQRLFNAINRGTKLLTASVASPWHLDLREDLRTRLGQGAIYRLLPLSDEAKRDALAADAARRGMALSAEALDYLLCRAPRDMRRLSALLAAIDARSLAELRPVSLPLIRETLAEFSQPDLLETA
ncbi:MAG: DnaA regulatory inactivator Hda [Zoogloeaceae bacterium]|jgi:DnaA family protein|nr:DnaA regulatory inactivator Hda [Zoogloeaceae bacterium]